MPNFRPENKKENQIAPCKTHTLTECMSICASCAKKCMEDGHKKAAALCTECADICALAIKSASCHLLDLCVEICKRCADECQTLQFQHCEECAQTCRQCAKVCSDNN